jgi:hypothetical protein
MENDIKKTFPSMRILYSRADEEKTGHLAICNLGLEEGDVTKIVSDGLESEGKHFTFSICEGEDLNKFWSDHGTHYQMCSGQKLRRAKKAKRDEDREAKKQKVTEFEPSFTIGGIKYSNASKVKSKARSIMNLKQNGDKLEGYEEEFMRFIIEHHEKVEQKMKDFDHFTVDTHP